MEVKGRLISNDTREKLQADRTYYVRTDGNDGNTGLVNSAGGAFLTLQAAGDAVDGLDLNRFNVTIQVGAGTYTSGITIRKLQGSGYLYITGDASTPDNVILNLSSGIAFYAFGLSGSNLVILNGFKISGTPSYAIACQYGAYVRFQNFNFACTGTHIFAANLGRVAPLGDYEISSGAQYHIVAQSFGAYQRVSGGPTITITGTPDFSGAFAQASYFGFVDFYNLTFSGSATGVRFIAQYNSFIFTYDKGVNDIPGDEPGKISQGSSFDNIPSLREKLLAARTYYIRTDGSDSNDGLSNSAAGAFLTLQAAANAYQALDCNGFDVTIQVGDGTYTAGVTITGRVGTGKLYLTGNTGTPNNVVISTAGACVSVAGHPAGSSVVVNGFKMVSSGSSCLSAANGSEVSYLNIDFGGASLAHVVASSNAGVTISGAYSITGNAVYHLYANQGRISQANYTVTITGALTFSVFALATALGNLFSANMTWSIGTSVTGTKYYVNLNSVINTAGGGGSYFPGDAGGSTATGGQYI
jgi:hypothetical protein